MQPAQGRAVIARQTFGSAGSKNPLSHRERVADCEGRPKNAPAFSAFPSSMAVRCRSERRSRPTAEAGAGANGEAGPKGVPQERHVKGVPQERHVKGVPQERHVKGTPQERRV